MIVEFPRVFNADLGLNWAKFYLRNRWLYCRPIQTYNYIMQYEFVYIPFNEIFEQITSKHGTTCYSPVTGYKQSKANTRR